MPKTTLRSNPVPSLLAWLLVAWGIVPGRPGAIQGAEKIDFVQQVRPILERHCLRCHGPEKQEAGLRLDQRQAALRGGDSYSPAIVPGKSDASPLFQFIARSDADLKMPPKGSLADDEIGILRRWIDEGAVWPEDASPATDPALRHWAYQPLRRPPVPHVGGCMSGNAIDSFIAVALREQQLSLSGPADRGVLIRRLYFDLLGIPPTPEEVTAFQTDRNPQAYEALVDRLLAAPQFGERWGRHWLDVVRFAESNGFEMNQTRPNAWRYRDYVIQAMNADQPYDQFVREQIAGDCLGEDVATGFLVAGPWDQVKSPDPVLTAQQRADELHDMVSTLGSAFLGLTVGCGRCHSHKFDPISQTDYYALKACLDGVQHGEREIKRTTAPAPAAMSAAKLEQLRAELADLETRAVATPINARVNVERFTPVLANKVRFTVRGTNQSAPCIDELEVWTNESPSRNVAAAVAGAKVRASGTFPNSDIHRLEHLNDGRYGNSRSWISSEEGRGWVEIEFARPETVQRILWGRDREEKFKDRLAIDYVIEVSNGGEWAVVATSADHQAITDATGKRQELERQLQTGASGERAYAGQFQQPGPTMRLHRGDPTAPREPVMPASLTHFGQRFELPGDSAEQERRLALANWIADPANPIVARVIVNRIWQQHFGEGIVHTPSDLGVNGGRPSHPELLDWLACELIDRGWSLKAIHRQIVLSRVYRQSSQARPDGLERDASARLLWRFPPRRLEAEPLRDAILAVCGNLDSRQGGPGFDLFEPNNNYVKVYQSKERFGPAEWRRMVYQSKPRMQLDNVFGAFDCPDAGQIAPRRTRSTTALQALNLLNSPFMVQQVEILAARLRQEAGDDLAAQVRHAFWLAFQREPSAEEQAAGVELARQSGVAAFCRAVLNANEFLYVF